jgi:hypothetical protein
MYLSISSAVLLETGTGPRVSDAKSGCLVKAGAHNGRRPSTRIWERISSSVYKVRRDWPGDNGREPLTVTHILPSNDLLLSNADFRTKPSTTVMSNKTREKGPTAGRPHLQQQFCHFFHLGLLLRQQFLRPSMCFRDHLVHCFNRQSPSEMRILLPSPGNSTHSTA